MDFWNLIFNCDSQGNRLITAEGEKRFVTLEDGRVIFVEGPGQGLGVPQREGWTITQSRFTPTGAGRVEFGEEIVAAPASETGSGIFAGDRELTPRWVEDLSHENAAALSDIVTTTWGLEGERRGVAIAAIETARDYPSARLLALFDEGDEGGVRDVYGVAAVSHSRALSPEYNTLDFMATKEAGYGRTMMQMVMQKAYEEGRGLKWTSIPRAKGFYEALGFAPFELRGHNYRVGPQHVTGWLEGQKANTALLEPADGVFAINPALWESEEVD